MPLLGSIIKNAIELRGKLPIDNFRKSDATKAQVKTLRKLLWNAQFTSFGEYYKFQDILQSHDLVTTFKKNIPIFDYDSMFDKWWFRAVNGEAFVSWPGKVKYFALSSGTSGATSKYIPVTADMIKAIKKTSIRQIWSLAKYDFPKEFYSKGILMLGGSTQLEYNGTYYEGDLSGITAGNIPFWFQHFYKPGKRIAKEKNWTQKLNDIVKKAPEWDIGVIVGVPAWLQILLERIIEEYKLETIHDIWPNLSIFVHGGVSFAPYVKGFEKLLAKPLTYIETYLASEGFIALQDRPNTSSMRLVTDNGLFYEFVPFTPENFDSEGNILKTAKSLSLNEVQGNVDYALLISTCAGAWRYLIGDTIKFTSIERCEIFITGRTKQFLSVCGEHLSQDNLNKAIEMLENQMNIHVREFAVCGIRLQEGMFEHRWFIGCQEDVNQQEVAEKLDENLKIINDDYKTERLHAIKQVNAEVIKPEVFYEWLKKHGKEGGQTKFPRVLRGEKLEDWLAFIKIK